MPPTIVLEIIKLSLELSLEIVRSIPKEQHQAFWEQHRKNVEFWEKLFDAGPS